MDGQEVAVADFNLLGSVAGLADDRVFAEWLRTIVFDGANTYKTILPYGTLQIEGLTPGTAVNFGTVQPTGSANGSVNVFPFRAVVGSRTSVGTSPALNWSDIRTALFTGAATLSQTLALAANSSGNPRWDLIYATVSVDTPSGTQTRRVKTPSTGVVTAQTVTTQLLNPVTVGQTQGTPGATPTIPALPSDSGGNYFIALAAVRVPNGFNSSTTIVNADIRDQVAISALQSPTTGVGRICPASGNNDQAGTYATDLSGPGAWAAGTAGQRPGVFLPPGLVGGEERVILIDANNSSHPSHANGSVVDDTIDWRNRFTRVEGQARTSTELFACDPSAGTTALPNFALTALSAVYSNTFKADAGLVAGASTLATYNTGAFGLYVLASDGKLRWFTNGSVANRFFLWIKASTIFPNK